MKFVIKIGRFLITRINTNSARVLFIPENLTVIVSQRVKPRGATTSIIINVNVCVYLNHGLTDYDENW